jgi:hypothetical protein
MRGTNVPPTRFDKRVDVSTSMAPLHCASTNWFQCRIRSPACTAARRSVAGHLALATSCGCCRGHSACANCALMDAFDAARNEPVRSCLCVCLVSAKRGIGPGCWPTEVGGPAGVARCVACARAQMGYVIPRAAGAPPRHAAMVPHRSSTFIKQYFQALAPKLEDIVLAEWAVWQLLQHKLHDVTASLLR